MDSKALIVKAVGNLYSRLTEGLSEHFNINGWVVLSEMEYVDFKHIKDANCIDRYIFENLANVNIEEDDKIACACGHHNIKNLTIMRYNGEYVILGSDCIKTLERYFADIAKIPNFHNKLVSWLDEVKKGLSAIQKKKRNKKCISCGKLEVSKQTRYKNEYRNEFCKDCCNLHKTKCVKCGVWRKAQKDWRGETMRYCPKCYFSSKHNSF